MAARPPFILAFAADSQGCGFHRVMMPLASLVESGMADGRLDLAIWPDEAGAACKPDVIVWQRQVEDAQIEAMARWRKFLPDALFIYDLDDNLSDIPAVSFHAGFMPPDIIDRIKRALRLCDRITTTTEPMAHWLRTLTSPTTPIDVVPNALPVARLRERKARTMGKLRIGFAGGISHTGDLHVLRPAMAAIGDEVTWVFFGMNMEDAPVDIEYHEGVPATLYLDKMLSLDLDLMLAPLEDNPFNRCKSNLRLVEAASIGAAVIAQDLTPYHVMKPPVFTYASSEADWLTQIRRFIDASKTERQRSADELRTWVGRHYTLERLLTARIAAWLPQDLQPWRPITLSPALRVKTIVACSNVADIGVRMPFLAPMTKIEDGLEAACRSALKLDADVLWLRSGTSFYEYGFACVKKLLSNSKEIASVVPLASDGENGFPQTDRWSPLPPEAIEIIAKLVAEQFGERSLTINAPTGPAVVLSVRALSMLGIPDVKGCDGNEEQAIMEWGLRAATRGWKHGQALGAFAGSVNAPAQPTQAAVLRIQARGLGEYLNAGSPDSVLAMTERAKLERRLLQTQWGGPRPGSMGFANDYSTWSLLRKAQEPNSGAIKLSDAPVICSHLFGDQDLLDRSWVIFHDEKTEVSNEAIYQFYQALKDHPGNNFLVMYADNDTCIGGKRSPEFKPDFDPTLFLAQDYVTPICAVHTSVLKDFPVNRTALFKNILRAYIAHGVRVFHHVSRVLGTVTLDATPETIALETLERQLVIEELYGAAVKITASRQIMGCLTVIRKWQSQVTKAPLVSIIIPTLGSGRLIQPCVATLLQHTTYPNYEVFVVQNGDQRTEPELSESILKDPRVHVVHWTEEFNWAKINNWAIRVHSIGKYIVTLNDDICIGSKGWLDDMMGHAVLPEIGAVGAKLIHPIGVLQHVGVVCHNGIAGHLHKGQPLNVAGHLGRALLAHENSAVTGACMLFSRANFDAISGFNASFANNYNDTVFCVMLHQLYKLRNVVETSAELMHPEASSRPDSMTSLEGRRNLLEDNVRLAKLCSAVDPYWNPNMDIISLAGGASIQGLNADVLAWSDFKPKSDSQRILLVNDRPGQEGCILDVLKDGDIPLLADLSGFTLRLLAPQPLNMAPWDFRNVYQLVKELHELGVGNIVLRSLVGAEGAAPPVEALRAFEFLRKQGIKLTVRPYDFALIAPWLVEDDRENENKLFGYANMDAWREAYEAVALSGES